MPDVASRSDVQILDNFIGGRWVSAHTTEFFDVHNPAVGDVIGRTPLSTGADVDAAVRAATRRVSRLARHAGQRARAGALPLQGPARRALRGDGAHRHHRARQNARRGTRQRPARHRVRRGGVRRAFADAGLWPGRHLARDRLPCRAPAARRLRRYRAFQLSGDGADVVSAVCDCHRQHLRPEAVRAGPAFAAQDGGPARAAATCHPASSTSSTAAATSSMPSAITRVFAPCRSSARRRLRNMSTSAGRTRASGFRLSAARRTSSS